MTRAEIKSFEWEAESSDHPVGLVLHAGPIGSPGDETFHVSVCTPAALNVLLERDGIVIGRHLLLVDRVDHTRIEAFLADRLRRIDGESWDVLAEKIGRIGYWEFEDYTPSPAGQASQEAKTRDRRAPSLRPMWSTRSRVRSAVRDVRADALRLLSLRVRARSD